MLLPIIFFFPASSGAEDRSPRGTVRVIDKKPRSGRNTRTSVAISSAVSGFLIKTVRGGDDAIAAYELFLRRCRILHLARWVFLLLRTRVAVMMQSQRMSCM